MLGREDETQISARTRSHVTELFRYLQGIIHRRKGKGLPRPRRNVTCRAGWLGRQKVLNGQTSREQRYATPPICLWRGSKESVCAEDKRIEQNIHEAR